MSVAIKCLERGVSDGSEPGRWWRHGQAHIKHTRSGSGFTSRGWWWGRGTTSAWWWHLGRRPVGSEGCCTSGEDAAGSSSSGDMGGSGLRWFGSGGYGDTASGREHHAGTTRDGGLQFGFLFGSCSSLRSGLGWGKYGN